MNSSPEAQPIIIKPVTQEIDPIVAFLEDNIALGPFKGLDLDRLIGGPGQLIFEATPRAAKRLRNREVKPSDSEITTFPQLFPPYERVRIENNGVIHISYIPGDVESTKDEPRLKTGVKKELIDKWRSYIEIETAIRTCYYIVYQLRPQGETTQELKAMRKVAIGLYNDFTSGKITQVNMPTYLDMVYQILEDNGLVMFRHEIKNDKDEIVEVINKRSITKRTAISRMLKSLKKDRLNRFNPLKSRTQLGASVVNFMEELLKAAKATRKYSKISSLLLLERADERTYLQEVIQEAQFFLIKRFKLKNTAIKVATEFKNFIKARLNIDVIKVNPYRKAAILAYVYAFGFPKHERLEWVEVFKKMFSPELVEAIDRIHSEETKGSEDSFKNLRDRVSFIIPLLESVLRYGDRELPDSFFEKFSNGNTTPS